MPATAQAIVDLNLWKWSLHEVKWWSHCSRPAKKRASISLPVIGRPAHLCYAFQTRERWLVSARTWYFGMVEVETYGCKLRSTDRSSSERLDVLPGSGESMLIESAIVFCKDGMTIWRRAGQNRAECISQIAALSCRMKGLVVPGFVHGLRCIASLPRWHWCWLLRRYLSLFIQPGGSMRWPEVIWCRWWNGIAIGLYWNASL